ncbi:Hamartin, partial [Orchesella cincta]
RKMASSLGSSGGGSSSGGPGGNHGQPQALTDVTQIFDLLESNKPDVVQEVKDLILENLNSTKESWLVSGLYEYYIQSGSGRCSDILCGISREPHDKFLIERMTDGIKSPLKETRRQALVLVGHAVCKQPPWLYKITQQPYLFRELIKLLKTETDVVILLTGLLAMIMMLPIIPMFIVCNIQDIFDGCIHCFIACMPCSPVISCHIFVTTSVLRINPMLEKVKMHPHLVTATKEGELNPARWRSRDYHDIISECSKISLDGYESSLPEEMPSGFSNLGSNTGNINERRVQNSTAELSLEDVLKIPNTTMFSQAMSTSDLNSLVNYIDDFSNTAPPTPLSVTTGSSSNVPMSHTGLTVRTNLPLPTETAMEATPENTPVKDRDRSHFKLPSYNTPAAIQLFGPEFVRHDRHDRPIPQTPPATPTNSSVPSSPLPVTSTLSRRDSIFDSSNFRRESLMLQRLQKLTFQNLLLLQKY